MNPAAGRSCLYECRVMHHRFAPREHRFVYSLFYFAFDLDELPDLDRGLRLLSIERRNVFRFQAQNYLPIGERLHRATDARLRRLAGNDSASLKERVQAFCAAHGVALGDATRVQLVTLPRVLGYQFNPVSFYFCSDADGRPRAAIAEVTNTFGEVKLYFVPPRASADAGGPAVFQVKLPKGFYVSPFSSAELQFEFTLRRPGEALALQVDDFDGERRVLHSTLTGRRMPLTDARLAWFLVKYPLVTLKVVTLIHWQALRLWVKRVPFFRKADQAAAQRDLFRPHSSIAQLPS